MSVSVPKRISGKMRRRQQGVAAIMFAIMLPVMLGFLTLGIEAGRYMYLKGQLRNAAESAALIVSALDSKSERDKKKIATAVVEAMMPDRDGLEVSVDAIKSDAGENGGRPFYEYAVNVTSDHNRWFPDWTGDGLAFQEATSLEENAIARKGYGSGLDVVFVADFSDSMNLAWESNSGGQDDDRDKKESKLDTLKTIIPAVAQKVIESSESLEEKNTVALVPFNYFTKTKKGLRDCKVTQWVGDSARNTYDKLFEEKTECQRLEDDKSRFNTINPMTSAAAISRIESMKAHHGTASHEGIIRAAQLLKQKGQNPSRLIIVLSDGEDSDHNGTKPTQKERHTKLLSLKYCDKIRDELNSEKVDGRPVDSRIAVIGFGSGYDVSGNTNLNNCADENMVYTTENMEDVYKVLLDLISNPEEMGSLYYPKPIIQPEESTQ